MKFGLLLLFAFCCCAVQAQTAPTNSASTHTGVITGRVLADNGRPLAGVAVMADSAQLRSAGARSATTNENGDFRLTGLAPAAYSLRATLPAYVMLPPTGAMGEPRFVHVGDTATITMAKGGVITGRVINANGEPIPGLSIKAIRLYDAVGQPVSSLSFARRTDDRGIYRIFGLPSGTYLVGTDGTNAGLSWNADEQAEDAPTYYPGSTRDAALELAVQTGLELTGIDIRYRGERGRTVSGKFFDSGNTGIVNIELRRPGSGDRVAVTWQGINRTQPNQGIGFELRGVADGEYDLVAERLSGDDDGAASATRRITVSGADVGGIELRLAPFASVSGKLALVETPTENKTACPSTRPAVFEEVTLSLWPEARSPQTARTAFPARSGDFTIHYLSAGRYRFNWQLPSASWYVRALTLSDARTQRKLDLARTGLAIKASEKLKDVTVTIATNAASLQGSVKVDAGAKAPARLRIHLVPVEQTAADEVLRYFETEATDERAFAFHHLAPGRYWLLVRALAQDEAVKQPAAWDNAERVKLRREAEAANNVVELQSCQRLKDYALKYAPK